MDRNRTNVGLWHSLRYADADAGLAWLTAIGFTEQQVHRDDSGVIVHAELRWPAGGGVMFGQHRESRDWPAPLGCAAAYLEIEDVDAVHGRALDAGGTSLYDPREEDYGGRGAGVRDPEGNLWSFGSYAPA